jgi:uncharacterized RmlC-like cupin family protein
MASDSGQAHVHLSNHLERGVIIKTTMVDYVRRFMPHMVKEKTYIIDHINS